VLYVLPPSCAVAIVDQVLSAVSDASGPMNAYVLRHLLGHFAATDGQPAR
jgi:hypothetical protein